MARGRGRVALALLVALATGCQCAGVEEPRYRLERDDVRLDSLLVERTPGGYSIRVSGSGPEDALMGELRSLSIVVVGRRGERQPSTLLEGFGFDACLHGRTQGGVELALPAIDLNGAVLEIQALDACRQVPIESLPGSRLRKPS